MGDALVVMFGRLDISALLANRDQEHRGVRGAECPNKHPRVPAVRTNTRVYRKIVTEGCRSRDDDTNRRAPMKVLYFPIKARNVLAQLVAKKGGLTCALETPAWVRRARTR